MTDPNVQLREVLPSDLPILFAYHCDGAAIQMAAFTGRDPGDLAAFEARWAITEEVILCLDGAHMRPEAASPG